MREILFRGKRLDNGEWAHGLLVHRTVFYGETCDKWIITEDRDIGPEYEVDSSTIGQYSGLTDRNGKQIFEGDIVKTKYGRLCFVVWFAPKLCFDLKPVNKFENLEKHAPDEFDLWYSNNLEVMGNIYDNKELLED